MRVIAGSAKSIRLKTPVGLSTRPTTDRIKETLFNMISPHLCDCCFLDLFSGSGAIGIEALSRGASEAVFVEQNAKAVACIRENLKNTRLEKWAKVIKGDVFHVLKLLEGKYMFDCIFMDPPYHMEYERKVLKALADSSCIHSDTIIIIEASLETDFSYLNEIGYEIIKQKTYKTNVHIFVSYKGSEIK